MKIVQLLIHLIFFNMYAGEEKSVAATKTFVQTLLILKNNFYLFNKKMKLMIT